VTRFTTDGTNLGVLFKLPNGENPYGLAVDPNTWTIYVGASSCCWVYSYVRDPNTGTYSQGPTITNNNFKYPSRVAVSDDGWVYAVDGNSNYINKYELDGNPLIRFGGTGGRVGVTVCCSTPLGKFQDGGRESTVDGSGNLWVADMPAFRAQVFGPEGTPLFQV